MGTICKASIFTESNSISPTLQIILRSPRHVSVESAVGPLRQFIMPERAFGSTSLCKRAIAVVTHDRRLFREMYANKCVRLVRLRKSWYVIVDVPARRCLPSPTILRTTSELNLDQRYLATAVGVSAIGLLTFRPHVLLGSPACVIKYKKEIMNRASFTKDEVAAHCTVENGWIIIGRDVYNITDLLMGHPDKVPRLKLLLGKATTFGAILAPFYIGKLAKDREEQAGWDSSNLFTGSGIE